LPYSLNSLHLHKSFSFGLLFSVIYSTRLWHCTIRRLNAL